MEDQLFVLDENGEPRSTQNMEEFGRFMATTDRHIGNTHGVDPTGEAWRVSTVFLAVNHQWGDGPPILWETMIFGGEHDGYQERYTSREEALAGHALALSMCQNNKEQA